jgi:hypothetical protein
MIFCLSVSASALVPCAISPVTGESNCPDPVYAMPYTGPKTGAVTRGSLVSAVIAATQSYNGRTLTLVKQRRDAAAGPGLPGGLIFETSALDEYGAVLVTIRLRTLQGRTAHTIITRTVTAYLGYADVANPAQTKIVMAALGLDPRISPFQRLPIRFPTPELGGNVQWWSDLQYAFTGGSWNASSNCNAATLEVGATAAAYLAAAAQAAAVQAASGAVAAIPLYLAATTAYATYIKAIEAQAQACGQP